MDSRGKRRKPKPVTLLSKNDKGEEVGLSVTLDTQRSTVSSTKDKSSLNPEPTSYKRDSSMDYKPPTPRSASHDLMISVSPSLPASSQPSRKRKASTIESADPISRDSHQQHQETARPPSNLESTRSKSWMPIDPLGAAATSAAWQTLAQKTGMKVNDNGNVSRAPHVPDQGQMKLQSCSQPPRSQGAVAVRQTSQVTPEAGSNQHPPLNSHLRVPNTLTRYPPNGAPPYPASRPYYPPAYPVCSYVQHNGHSHTCSSQGHFHSQPYFQGSEARPKQYSGWSPNNDHSSDLLPNYSLPTPRLPAAVARASTPALPSTPHSITSYNPPTGHHIPKAAPSPHSYHIPPKTPLPQTPLQLPTPTEALWTTTTLTDFAMTLQNCFPFAQFAHDHNLPLKQVFSLFSALVHSPILDFSVARKKVEEWQGLEQ